MSNYENIKKYLENYKLYNSNDISPVVSELMGLYEFFDSGIHITDGKGYTLYYNKESEEIDGLGADDIVGRNMRELVDEGIFSKSIALEVIEKRLKVETTQKVQDRVIYVTGIPIFHNDEIIRVLVSSKDISKLTKYESQLKELKVLNETYKKELSISNYAEIEEDSIICKSKTMKQVKSLALRVSKVNSTVLIDGESGTGKGLLSSYIHKNSLRNNLPFFKIDCSAIPETLLESELFGYEEGSFTGSKKGGKIGLIQLADKGTLFLDEIGELSLKLQAKLLRVIQDRVIYRLGGTKAIDVDIRIIAASNRNLLKMIKEGSFREDLYYRLSVIPIHIPPLRERREDITPLILDNLDRLNSTYSVNKKLSPDALRLLIDYDWPGNVRELQNVVERLVVTTQEDQISSEDIYRCNLDIKDTRISISSGKSYKEIVSDFESDLLIDLMKRSDNLKEMSDKAQLNSSTIRKKVKRLGLELKF